MSLAEDFTKFYEERVRSVAQGYPEVSTEKVTFKEIIKAYNRWAANSSRKRYSNMNKDVQAYFKELCKQKFTVGEDDVFQHLRVFLDEEDIEEFDKEHELKGTDDLHLPTATDYTLYNISSNSNIPPEAAVTIILARDDKERQLENIIKLSRVFYQLSEERLRYGNNLEATIKRKDEYIAKLLNKIALMYIALPDK